ncbi:spermatogenesis-associated serine-rich protein 1 isoform X3 [Sagmatias obliquidens]|uniref:spermatogenesis-associated serine-rich protein 1 isoform X3 n=1 Tax=Sagmatias obliquidens TaxID=3371155 RepID=UPI000F445C99|nr:spermatogenesis-associated serine-rich protein 1 isoform X3 [Lagenorhynchus obliquidens]
MTSQGQRAVRDRRGEIRPEFELRDLNQTWRKALPARLITCWLLLIFKTDTCIAPSMDTGNCPRGCQLPPIYTAICSSELEKVQEKGDSGMTTGEWRYSTKLNYFLESKGCFANIMSSGRSVSPSSSIETGLSVSGPFSTGRGSVHPDPAADSDLKSSSSHSDHSSETSLPEARKDKYRQEFSLLKLQTIIDPRNGIPKVTPGDNPYMCPEQSKGFHKAGSTLPPGNFSIMPYEKKFDTFIPLEPLPQIPNLPFWVKEKANKLKNEIREVEELDSWQPAVPLLQSLLPVGGSKNLQKVA